MALAVDLGGRGLPMELANALGFSSATAITTTGTTIGSGALTLNNALVTPVNGANAYTIPASAELLSSYFVTNVGAVAANVFPPAGSQINNGAVAASIAIAAGQTRLFVRINGARFASFITS